MQIIQLCPRRTLLLSLGSTPATYPTTPLGTADYSQTPVLHRYVSSFYSTANAQHLTASSTPSPPSPSAFVGSAYSTLKAKTNLRLLQHALSLSGLSAPSLAAVGSGGSGGGHNKPDSIGSSVGPGAGAGNALSNLNVDAQMSDFEPYGWKNEFDCG